MSESGRELPSQEEAWISGDYVAGVVDNEAERDAAVADLERHGLSQEAVRVYSGPADAEELSQRGGEGILGEVRRAIDDYAGNAKELTDRLEAAAARGQHVVMVALADGADADEVRRVLAQHGAHDLTGRIGGFTQGWVDGGYAA